MSERRKTLDAPRDKGELTQTIIVLVSCAINIVIHGIRVVKYIRES
jgi:hypothetical protein